jgi:hypothetical protein
MIAQLCNPLPESDLGETRPGSCTYCCTRVEVSRQLACPVHLYVAVALRSATRSPLSDGDADSFIRHSSARLVREAAGIEPAAFINKTRERTQFRNATHSRTHAVYVPCSRSTMAAMRSRRTIIDCLRPPVYWSKRVARSKGRVPRPAACGTRGRREGRGAARCAIRSCNLEGLSTS